MGSEVRWFIGMVMLFALCSIMANILEQSPDMLNEEQIEIIGDMATDSGEASVRAYPEGGDASFVDLTRNFFVAAKKVLLWDYCWFTDEWLIVKYIVFWPISAGLLIALALTIRRLTLG